MNAFLNGLARAVAETFELPEPILEIGSYQVDGARQSRHLRTSLSRTRLTGRRHCGPVRASIWSPTSSNCRMRTARSARCWP